MPPERFELTQGSWDDLSTYQFNKMVAKHTFCPSCGISFASSAPGRVVVNVKTVDEIDVDKLQVFKFDGAKNL